MLEGIEEAFEFYIKALIVVGVLFVPMGLWKWIEVIIWLVDNISIQIGG